MQTLLFGPSLDTGHYWTLLILALHSCHVAWLSRQQAYRPGLPPRATYREPWSSVRSERLSALSTTLGISVAPLNQNGPHLDMGWLR